MAFMNPDESIILMDMAEIANPAPYRYIPMSSDELAKLGLIGVQTVLEQAQWELAEPSQGVYDWSHIDDQVNRPRRAGMKVLLSVPGCVPKWCPLDWYATPDSPDSPLKYVDWRWWPTLSMWNMRAQKYMMEFEARVIDRYASPDVLCIHGYPKDGEAMLPPLAEGYFDPEALADYREFCDRDNAVPGYQEPETQDWLRETVLFTNLAHQRIFAAQNREVWCFLHPYHARYQWTGNQFVGDVYAALAGEGWKISAVQYTHFPLGDEQAAQVARAKAATPGIDFWVGAEYAEGAPVHAPKAVAQGLRGLLCAPLHPFQGHQQLEGWMMTNLSTAISTLQGGRHDG